MATQSSQNTPPPFKTADSRAQADNKPTSPFTERPTSLYKPRDPAPSFGQASAQRTGSAFSRPSQQPAFGSQKPEAPGSAKPFASLRSQTDPQGTAPAATPFSRFSRPADTPASGSALGQKTAPRPAATGGATLTSRLKSPATETRSTSPFRKDLHITDEEFLLLRDFIYQQCGIFIAENRKYLVENRLSNRIKDLNLKSYNEYYNYLRFDANKRQELTRLFEVVTTNETSFFRNPPQLEVFQRVVLAEAINQCRKSGQKKLRIWSAGCSTGEEPYTLAIILNETLRGELPQWDIKITANDLSEAVLASARQGIYNEYALRTTPRELVDKYFKKDGNVYRIDPALKRLVSFGQINLSDRDQLKRVERSQIVFCRNVIIYFDDEMKRKVINAFYDNLLPAGVLIIGHSESLHNISRAFQLEHHKGTILYRKSS